jgi:predicted nucleotidyltransferase
MRWIMDLRIRPEQLFDTKAKQKVLKYVMANNFTMTAAEVARMAKMPVMTAHRVLNFFESAGLVSGRRVGTAIEWRERRESYAYKTLESVYTPLRLVKLPLDQLKSLILRYLPSRLVLEAKLFGSMARGDFNESSDVDLFVVVKSQKQKKQFEKYDEKLGNALLSTFGKVLMPYVLTENEYRRKKSLAVIKNIEKEGLKLK